ncbi:MAG: hypothetical protein U0941_28130 [Planctomycetaceae bacterium]
MPHPIPFAISSADQIDQILKDLHARIDRTSSYAELVADFWTRYTQTSAVPFVLVLVASDLPSLQKETQICQQTWSRCWTTDQDWKTPAGSILTPQPAGATGKLAFVYPGIGSLYPGYSRDLLKLFPKALDGLPVPQNELMAMLHREHLWPADADGTGMAEGDWPLYRDIVAQAEATVSLAYVWTHLLRDRFGIQPTMALGYSLGELAMFSGCGCWQQPQELAARFRQWPSFRQHLSNEMTLLQSAPSTQGMLASEWSNCLVQVTGSIPEIRHDSGEQIYVTHLNTSRELVIAGRDRDISNWLTRHGARGQALPSRLIYHCEPVKHESEVLQTLFELPVAERPAIDFVSMPPFGRVPHDSKMIARTLVNTAVRTVDWPEIVGLAYQRGARVFVEIGPRNSCSSWIQTILSGKPHTTASTDRKGIDVGTTLARMFAHLMSHRVAMSEAAVMNWVIST